MLQHVYERASQCRYLTDVVIATDDERVFDAARHFGAIVRMKLTSFRDKDRTHLRDLIGVGLIDASWCDRLPTVLADRLRELLATPEG